jgi:hypothetical protein
MTDQLRATLAHHYNGVYLVAGIVLGVTALPGMPEWVQLGSSVDGLDLAMLVWAIGSVALWGLARVWVDRGVFLLEVVFQLAIAAWWIYGIATGQRDLVWGLIGLLCFAGVWLAFRQYRRLGARDFRPPSPSSSVVR